MTTLRTLFHAASAFIFLSMLVGLVLPACSDDVLTDGAAQPSFVLNDSDSYNLGILLMGQTTATQRLMLYNANAGEICLQRLALRGGDSSLFRINVDGMAGSAFTDPDFLHIASGDSLCVLVEASFNAHQTEVDVVRQDYIDILCNGQQTSIRLTVTTRSTEQLASDTIRHDTVWQEGGLNKLLRGQLIIAPGATLTIGPGVTLYLHDHAGIEVQGTLRMQGTVQSPVTLIGDRTDRIFDNLYYRDMSAQWGGIRYTATSTGNLIEGAIIKGMTTGIELCQDSTDTTFLSEAPQGLYVTGDPKRYLYGPDFMTDERQQLIIRSSIIMNSDSSLISARKSNMIIENSLLMNSAGAILELSGGAYDITHCTLANYNYWAAFSKCDVELRNYYLDTDTEDLVSDVAHLPAPLYRCNFTNSIIYGNSQRDPNINTDYAIFVDDRSQRADSIFNYRLDHCLIHSTTGFDDDDCLSVLWSQDPQYRLVDMPNYTVDAHLQDTSPCLTHGDARTVTRLPLDLDGQTRLGKDSVAIGCYQN